MLRYYYVRIFLFTLLAWLLTNLQPSLFRRCCKNVVRPRPFKLTLLQVYQYSIYDTPSTPKKSTIVPPNENQPPELLGSESGGSSDDEAATALENAVAELNEDSDSSSDSDEMSEDSDADEPASRTKHSGLDRPVIQPRKEYRGAGNVRTVKDGVLAHI